MARWTHSECCRALRCVIIHPVIHPWSDEHNGEDARAGGHWGGWGWRRGGWGRVEGQRASISVPLAITSFIMSGVGFMTSVPPIQKDVQPKCKEQLLLASETRNGFIEVTSSRCEPIAHACWLHAQLPPGETLA
jgi:hypothetical protein